MSTSKLGGHLQWTCIPSGISSGSYVRQARDLTFLFSNNPPNQYLFNYIWVQFLILWHLKILSLFSEFGLWHQLEHTDKEGRIPFHWSNSFSQHKKFLSLMIRPGRPPPVQVSVS